MLDKFTESTVRDILARRGFQIDDEDDIEDILIQAANALIDAQDELDLIEEKESWGY